MFYSREGLQKLCEDLKVDFDTLEITENDDYKKTIISGPCQENGCEETFSFFFKTFRRGAKCNKHRPSFDIDFLNEYCNWLKIRLTETYTIVTKKTFIKGYCINPGCKNIFEKKFLILVESAGPYCEKCTKYLCKQRKKITNLRRFGVEFSMQNENVREKGRQTLLKKYGVENATQTPETREKMRQTMLERYGVEYISQSPEIQAKIKQTNLEKYGVAHAAQNLEIQQKTKLTMLKKYGVESATQTPETREKMKQTILERYGVENASQSPEIREKIKQTNLEKYGVEHTLQDPQLRERIKQINLVKYGVEHVLQNPQTREKMKRTILERYGVEYITQSPEIQEKIKQTNLEKYGVEHTSQNSEIQERITQSLFKHKIYILPSNKTIKLQGYEPHAMDILLKKYKEEDIVTGPKNVPEMWWNDLEEKSHRHYVDIYIPKTNTMIEVKSDYSFTRSLESTLRKQDAAQDQNYNYQIWIFNGKKQLIAIIYQAVPCTTIKWLIRDEKLKEIIEIGVKFLLENY